MEKNNFYVTSYSAGIEYGCVTPFSCMNAVEHKNPGNANTLIIMKSQVFLCIRGLYCSIVFKPEKINAWFEVETIAAIPAAVQGSDTTKMSCVQKLVTQNKN
jgi:hypothetical protein